MIKHKLAACLGSGLLFISPAYPQLKISNATTQQQTERCAPDADAYAAAQVPYLDCVEQLSYLRVQLASYRKQYDDLWDQCAHANNQLKSKVACDELGLLGAGKYAIALQDYLTLAQRGCPVPPPLPPVKQVAKNCAVSGAGTGISNVDSQTQPAPAKGSAKVASNQPTTARAPVQQFRKTENPGSTVQPRMQPIPATPSTRTSVVSLGNRSTVLLSGGATPSPANGSAGAGRVKAN